MVVETIERTTAEEPEKEREPQKKSSVCLTIPMWNRRHETDELARAAVDSLKHVDRGKVDLRLVLVDNRSPLFPYWAADRKDLDLLLLRDNRGFGPAVNLGMKVHPKTDYVCQMNTDVALIEDSVNILIGAIERFHLDVAMPEHYENCAQYNLGKTDELMTQEWRFGAFWVAKRSMWDRIDGFDEDFEMCYWEDTAAWAKIESLGGKIAGFRGTWVSHRGGSSSHPDRDFYFEKNRKLFEERWGKA